MGHKMGVDAMQQTLDALTTELVARGPGSLSPQVPANWVIGQIRSPHITYLYEAADGEEDVG